MKSEGDLICIGAVFVGVGARSSRMHTAKFDPLPFEKGGGCTFGVEKWWGGFENLEIKGHLFRSGQLIFQSGLDSQKGYALSWIWKVPYFKNFRLQQVNFPCLSIFDEPILELFSNYCG